MSDMKERIVNLTDRILLHIPVGLICLMLLFSLYTWIGNICGIEVRSLYSADGIRWCVTHFVSNIGRAPFAEVLTGLVTLSVMRQSGIMLSLNRRSSLKQKRALSFSLLVLLIGLAIVVCLLLPPYMVLLNPFGKIANSPFTHGLYAIICLLLIVVCNVYGLISGRFVNLSDMVEAHTHALKRHCSCFIIMMLIAEFIGCLSYSGLLIIPADSYHTAEIVMYSVPLFLSILHAFLKE